MVSPYDYYKMDTSIIINPLPGVDFLVGTICEADVLQVLLDSSQGHKCLALRCPSTSPFVSVTLLVPHARVKLFFICSKDWLDLQVLVCHLYVTGPLSLFCRLWRTLS